MEGFERQETRRGTYPTTLTFRPKYARLEIIHKTRDHIDWDEAGQSRERPNASRFYQDSGFGPAVVVQFLVAVKDIETNDLWYCNMRNKNRMLLLDNGGVFFIEVSITPNAHFSFPSTDHRKEQLPNYIGNIKCILPVESATQMVYHIKVTLYKNDRRKRETLDMLQFHVLSHLSGHDLFDLQGGRSITEVERPQLKIEMTGILGMDVGRKIVMHFQNLGDNGLYGQFEEDEMQLFRYIEGVEGKDHLRDLKLSVQLEKSSLQFGQNRMADCEATAKDVIKQINIKSSPNYPFLVGKAYYVISAVHRQADDFESTKEYLETSTEVLERVRVCEDTSVNQYNWHAYYSEKNTKTPLSLPERKEAEFRHDNALSHWKQQKENTTNRGAMKSLIRNINFNLCTSRKEFPDRSKPVTEENLFKAAQSIKTVKQNLLQNASKRHQVTFNIAESDYYIRRSFMEGSIYTPEIKKQNAEKAVSILCPTLKAAENLGLKKEVEGIKDRLMNLERLHGIDVESELEQSTSAMALTDGTFVERITTFIDDLLQQLDRESTELRLTMQ